MYIVDPTKGARSASQRLLDLHQLQQKKRRRGYLLGLLAGQVLIIALDLGGSLFLKTHPQLKIQAPIGVPSIVFLGMAIGAALMMVAISSILVVQRKGILQTLISMTVTIVVIIGTAWFMIPQPEWTPTIRFAQEKGLQAVRSMVRAAP